MVTSSFAFKGCKSFLSLGTLLPTSKPSKLRAFAYLKIANLFNTYPLILQLDLSLTLGLSLTGSKTPFGLENGDITDAQLEASSNSASAANGRLYNASSWCSSTASSSEYFQVGVKNVSTEGFQQPPPLGR